MNGIERQIDHLGRVVIPIEYRKKLGIKNNSKVFILLEDGKIIIRAERAVCAFCGKRVDNEIELRLCCECIARVKACL